MDKIIKLQSHQETQALFGRHDENIKLLEKEFKVKLNIRGEHLKISGTAINIKKASNLIEYILQALRSGQTELGKADLYYMIANFKKPKNQGESGIISEKITRSSGGREIGPKTKGQAGYVEAITKYDIVFGIGPAGTGKTYLAMACAVESFKK
ncbi:MAG: PhoH family protein, partial [Candidatus Omnitrophica bacterium]|nr:PhoH family protein [Candidatus Omnitrophota bacterium]